MLNASKWLAATPVTACAGDRAATRMPATAAYVEANVEDGTLAVGQTCADAFLRMYFLERACTMQVRALSGAKSNPVHQGVPEKVAGQCETMFTRTNIPSLAWEALRRRLDREDPSYRD